MIIIRGTLTNATGYSFPVSITDTYYGILHNGIPIGTLNAESINLIKHPNAKVNDEYTISTIDDREFTLKITSITSVGGRRSRTRRHRKRRSSRKSN